MQVAQWRQGLVCTIQYGQNQTSNVLPPPRRSWTFPYYDGWVFLSRGLLALNSYCNSSSPHLVSDSLCYTLTLQKPDQTKILLPYLGWSWSAFTLSSKASISLPTSSFPQTKPFEPLAAISLFRWYVFWGASFLSPITLAFTAGTYHAISFEFQ